MSSVTQSSAVQHSVEVALPAGVYAGVVESSDVQLSAELLRCRFEEQRALRRKLLSPPTHQPSATDRAVRTEPLQRTSARTAVPQFVAPTRHSAAVAREGTCAASDDRVEDACHAVRTAAAERALQRLQCENDSLKRNEAHQRQQQCALQRTIDRLRAELTAMGETVAKQTATLSAVSVEMERRDAYHLIKAKRGAGRDAADGGLTVEAELAQCKQSLQAASAEREGLQTRLDETSRRLREAEAQVQELRRPGPEAIERDDDVVSVSWAAEAGRTLAALNLLCDQLEALDTSAAPTTEGPPLELFRVSVRVLSCVDLPASALQADAARGINGAPLVLLRGPCSAEDSAVPPSCHNPLHSAVLMRTKPFSGPDAERTCPVFTADDDNEATFRVVSGAGWWVSLEVHVETDSEPVLLGIARIPVGALLSTGLLASKSGAARLHVTPLQAPGLAPHEDSSRGSVCFECAVTPYGGAKATPLARAPPVAAPPVSQDDVTPVAEIEKPKSTSPFADAKDTEHEPCVSKSEPPAAVRAEEAVVASHSVTDEHAAQNEKKRLTVFIKAAEGLKDQTLEDTLESPAHDGGVVVQARTGDAATGHATTPAKSPRRPRWDRQSGELALDVSSADEIVFELHITASSGETESLGVCTISAADVLGALGERVLPVRLNDEEHGRLTVDFSEG